VTRAAQNPYQGIIERNVFGLRPPTPTTPPEVVAPPAPKITLTGVTTILGKKMVLFKVQSPARPPEPAKEQSFILSEGQREGQIEVLEIDEHASAIKFNNYGTVMTLTMEKDGAKIPNTPPLVAAPVPQPTPYANPANPGTYAPPPPMPTATMPPPGAEGVQPMKTIPTRTLRLPNRPATPAEMPPLPGQLPQPQQQ
jgi:hypothetical protein